jgi:signal transduction histidine kinase
MRRELGVFVLALVFIALIHQAALQDRFLLILYYLGTAGACYALVRRRAFGLAAMTGAALAATIFASTYYAAKPDVWHPWFDPIRDMAGLAVVTYLTVGMLIHLYRYEREEKQREIKRIIEQKTVEMRAAALRATSHEVRTPLTVITALTETLIDETAGPLNETQRGFIKDMDGAASHLLELIDEILDFAKAEAGMIKLSPESVAVLPLVEQCVGMVEPKADAAGVTVSAQVDQGLEEIVADPLRLKQILINLLSNAVKYNDRGGAVNVRVRPDGDDGVLIAVRDTGRGIAPEHMQHLFDPYYQAAVADQSIGTGLGLAIIKHLTELHSGTVTVDSVVGAGSVFFVRLPKEAPGLTAAEGQFSIDCAETAGQAVNAGATYEFAVSNDRPNPSVALKD